MAKWNHDKVILALVKRGEKVANLENDSVYVHLYPQKPNVAYIWTQSSLRPHDEGVLWFREGHKNFDKSKISGQEPFLQVVGTYKTDWFKYKVLDWDAFANKLGLTFGDKDDDE